MGSCSSSDRPIGCAWSIETMTCLSGGLITVRAAVVVKVRAFIRYLPGRLTKGGAVLACRVDCLRAAVAPFCANNKARRGAVVLPHVPCNLLERCRAAAAY